MKSSRWSVGEVARQFGLPTNVLRHWESVGLLAPERDAAGRRRYGHDDVVRAAVVQRNKDAGMSLEQIRVLVDSGADDTSARHRVLEDHIADLDRRMEQMRLSREMTEHALRCQAHDITTCPRFRSRVTDLLAGFGD